jgi:hypothetical protein
VAVLDCVRVSLDVCRVAEVSVNSRCVCGPSVARRGGGKVFDASGKNHMKDQPWGFIHIPASSLTRSAAFTNTPPCS